MIKVYITDDHEMFREGVKVLLSKLEGIEVIGESPNGKHCTEHLLAETDVLLMDISMPEMNGIETTQKIIEQFPDMKIIALSMFGDEDYYYKMIHSGVKGFVLKEAGSKELETAIRDVFEGRNFFSQELLRNVIASLGSKKSELPKEEETVVFTPREIELFEQICIGKSNKEIADELCISTRTVETHKSHLMQKTGAKNTVGLVMYALKNEIINLQHT